MKNKNDNKPYFDEREVFIKTINEKDKRIAELEAECERLRTDANPTLLKGEEVIAIAEKVIASAPVAKPLVWEQLSESTWNGYYNKLISFSICNGYNGDDAYSLIGYINGVDIKAFVDIPFHTLEAAKQVAQDWLNKLVADMSIASTCPENVSKNGEDLKVSENSEIPNNPTCKEILQVPQFTAEEIDGIRKLAQFSGFMIANSIIAKCEAMLKGVQE